MFQVEDTASSEALWQGGGGMGVWWGHASEGWRGQRRRYTK